MSLDDNKAVARRFFERFTANDIPGVLALLSEDATYWILGRREVISAAGEHSKSQMAAMFEAMTSRMQDGMKMSVIGMIAEGDRIAVEAEGYAPC